MKTLLSLLFFLLTMMTCSGQKESVIEKYSNGHKKVVHIYNNTYSKDSIIKMVGYRENGDLSFTGFLLAGKLHGVITQWYIDADQIWWQTNFDRQRKEGLETYWYRNGQKQHEVNYIKDFKQGTETQWYETGAKKSEGTWESGKQIGQWSYWHENGQVKEQGIYKGGQFEELPFYSSKSRPDFIPLKDGIWTYWTATSGTVHNKIYKSYAGSLCNLGVCQ
jgi:hypothetical protein